MASRERHHAAAVAARRPGELHRSGGDRRVGQAIGAAHDLPGVGGASPGGLGIGTVDAGHGQSRGADEGSRADRRTEPLQELRAEARYRRERLALYKARLYAGRARGLGKLRDLQRSSDGAAERLRRAREKLAAGSNLAQASRSGEEWRDD